MKMRELCISISLLILATLAFVIVTAGCASGAIPPEEEWNKTFGGTDDDWAWSVQQTSDGGYIIAGTTESYGAGYGDFWLVKTDSEGNEEWNKTFGGTYSDGARSVQQTSDGGYILAGDTFSYGAGYSDFWLVKTDSEGNKEWSKTFGGNAWDGARSVQQTSDGGYIIAGYTGSYGAGGDDFWLVKVKGEQVENQPPIASFNYSPLNPVVNQPVTFDASSSYDPDGGNITNYKWDFGDGNITSTTAAIITHFYSKAGSYVVKLTVKDDEGAKNTTSKTITVSLEKLVFDTGEPANPYPSIMGTHYGTIKPNVTIEVFRLYTYPCEGTGGHTEYARIWNNTFNATAKWGGYEGDWKNITFDKTFTLFANETYFYEIRTGSYPQIIHAREFDATGGTITCDKFIDENGNVYYNWIPAIRLW